MGIWGKNISGRGTACEKLRGRLALAAMIQARKEADLDQGPGAELGEMVR